MKVDKITTLRRERYPNMIWVEVRTDTGITGLGESMLGPGSVESYIHDLIAPYLLGKNPLEIERHNSVFQSVFGAGAASTEARGNSAIDIALWDIAAKEAGQPLHTMLGGLSRDRVRAYNTCAGPLYAKGMVTADAMTLHGEFDDFAFSPGAPSAPDEPPNDYLAFLEAADELAHELVSEGFTCMKIWPFDEYAFKSEGRWISAADLEAGLEPFRKIRDAVGKEIDVIVELHGYWKAPVARRIIEAVEEFEPVWIEDPVPPAEITSLPEVARGTRLPLAVSEAYSGRHMFRAALESEAVGVAICDVGWCGGLSEARRIGIMADVRGVPLAPHDCTGPVVLAASVHLSQHVSNAIMQEVVRSHLRGWYAEIAQNLPVVEAGHVQALDLPGHGVSLVDDAWVQPDAIVRASSTSRPALRAKSGVAHG